MLTMVMRRAAMDRRIVHGWMCSTFDGLVKGGRNGGQDENQPTTAT
jgi:hypothetical protein